MPKFSTQYNYEHHQRNLATHRQPIKATAIHPPKETIIYFLWVLKRYAFLFAMISPKLLTKIFI